MGSPAAAEEAETLAARTSEGRSFVACVGQFKRGKSSVINALVGSDILPTGTAPVTSVVTVVRHGDPQVRVKLEDGDWLQIEQTDLPSYATEELNPGNARGVRAIEVFAPAEILSNGMCLVDTPGLGSVFDANTDATREFVPHVDAALVVLGADPPITAEELALVEQMAEHVEHFIFVMNKIDRVRPDELDAALRFTTRVLTERLGPDLSAVYCVSALRRGEEGAGPDWARLQGRLRDLADASGRALVAAALRRGVERLTRRLSAMLDQEEAALVRPLHESRDRLAALRAASAMAQESLRHLGPLFDAELAALNDRFGARRAEFIGRAFGEAGAVLRSQIEGSTVRFGPAIRQAAFDEAHRLGQAALLPWLKSSASEADAAYRQVASRFTAMAERALESLQAEGVWLELGLSDLTAIEAGFGGRSRFVFTDLLRLSSPAGLAPLLRRLADAVLPPSLVRKSAEREALRFLHDLLEVNAARVENDLKQRIQDNRLRLEGRIRVALKEILRSAEAAIEQAREAQDRGEAAVEAALASVRERRAALGATQGRSRPP